ncbi:MAG: hypothetical protein CMJ89_04550 [Planctomycetes bacterium]|nr:hypothetical protein [Planctomycetota bacterium]
MPLPLGFWRAFLHSARRRPFTSIKSGALPRRIERVGRTRRWNGKARVAGPTRASLQSLDDVDGGLRRCPAHRRRRVKGRAADLTRAQLSGAVAEAMNRGLLRNDLSLRRFPK